MRNGGLETVDGGDDDSFKAFLVDWHLDSDMRRHKPLSVGSSKIRLDCRVESCVAFDSPNGTKDLKQICEDDNDEEEADQEEKRCQSDEGHSDVVSVRQTFKDEVGSRKTEKENSNEADSKSNENC